ncbi:unnamed protein product [Linum tenue]|uniref:Cytochrome P450 n=1 Tax=Linum tenue TaxID=586396 RepID=A0AAV0GT15_9ROSI|nr:unnamed protein product [Linum tenue]
MVGDQPHRRLRDLARKHGPDVMRLQLGELSCIVISTPEAAKLMRKICTLELLSAQRVRSFRSIREAEVSDLVASIARAAAAGKAVDLSTMLPALTTAITSRAAFGKSQQLTTDRAFQVVFDNISEVLGGFAISDLYPSLKWLPALTGLKARLEKLRKASDSVLDRIIDDNRSRKSSATTAAESKGDDEENVLDILLNLQESQDAGVPITMDVIKAVTLVDTSASTVEWSMSEMINNPRILHKAQQEVRQALGDDPSLHRLKYLDMVIAETLRLHPPGPLLVPRENRERQVELNSYVIPANTHVIVNAWAVNRDPRYWTEAERFVPERFVDRSIDYTGNDFQFIPFGAGRRMCPGVSFGTAVVKLTLASLLFHFDWSLPAEQKSINLTECFGATLRRQYALHLLPTQYCSVL